MKLHYTRGILLLFLFISFNSYSQNKDLDSLKLEWKKFENRKLVGFKDTTRLNILMQMGRIYQGINIDSAFIFHHKASNIIEELLIKIPQKNKEEISRLKIRQGEAYRQMGWNYYVFGEYEKADSMYSKAMAVAESYTQLNRKSIVCKEALRLLAAAKTNKGSWLEAKSQYKESIAVFLEAYEIAEEIGNLKIQAAILGNLSVTYRILGEWKKAIYYSQKALPIYKKMKNQVGLMNTYGNLGVIYLDNGSFPKALEYFFKGLKIAQEEENLIGHENMLTNIGNVYHYQKDYKKALKYYKDALNIALQMKNSPSIARIKVNIGIIYFDNNEIEKAKKFYKESMELSKEIEYNENLAKCYYNLAVIAEFEKDYKYAYENYKIALELNEEIGVASSIIKSKTNLASILIEFKKYNEAEKYLNEALPVALEMKARENLKEIYIELSKLYEKINKSDKALFYFKQFAAISDTLSSEDDFRATMQQEFEFNYEKKAAEDSIAAIKEKEIKNAQIAKQEAELKTNRYLQYSLFGGIALVLIFALFMYNRFRVIRQQHKIIELQRNEVQMQKEMVEEKHKEITDSINYAERIQRSLMASKSILDENLKEYFIYFQPKDVVSGDFYWACCLTNGQFCLVTADSTGHGVPGAIMSMLNINSLKEAVKEGLTEPSEILNQTRTTIIQTLANDGSIDGGKDGMDCSLLSFDFKNKQMSFALANNPIWLIRNGELLEFVADKMPIGKHDKQNISFTKHQIGLLKGDIIYAFTDGYADQFGGVKGKKFKYANMKKLLLNNSTREMDIQRELLNNELQAWKGDLEQIDDICIIGIKI